MTLVKVTHGGHKSNCLPLGSHTSRPFPHLVLVGDYHWRFHGDWNQGLDWIIEKGRMRYNRYDVRVCFVVGSLERSRCIDAGERKTLCVDAASDPRILTHAVCTLCIIVYIVYKKIVK